MRSGRCKGAKSTGLDKEYNKFRFLLTLSNISHYFLQKSASFPFNAVLRCVLFAVSRSFVALQRDCHDADCALLQFFSLLPQHCRLHLIPALTLVQSKRESRHVYSEAVNQLNFTFFYTEIYSRLVCSSDRIGLLHTVQGNSRKAVVHLPFLGFKFWRRVPGNQE